MLTDVELKVLGWPTWMRGRTDLKNSFRGQVGRAMRREIEKVKELAIENTFDVSASPEIDEIASSYRVQQETTQEGFYIGITNDHDLFAVIEYDTEPHWPNAAEGSRFWNWAAGRGFNERYSYEGRLDKMRDEVFDLAGPDDRRTRLVKIQVLNFSVPIQRRADLTPYLAARAVARRGTKGKKMLESAWNAFAPSLDSAAEYFVDRWVDDTFFKDGGIGTGGI